MPWALYATLAAAQGGNAVHSHVAFGNLITDIIFTITTNICVRATGLGIR